MPFPFCLENMPKTGAKPPISEVANGRKGPPREEHVHREDEQPDETEKMAVLNSSAVGAKETGQILPPTASLSSLAQRVHVPTYHDLPAASKRRRVWSRPKTSLIEDIPHSEPSRLPAYDADEEDEVFVRNLERQSARQHPKLTITDLEMAFEALERECHAAETHAALQRNEHELKCRKAASVAVGEFLLKELSKGASTSSSADLEAKCRVVGDKASLEMRSTFPDLPNRQDGEDKTTMDKRKNRKGGQAKLPMPLLNVAELVPATVASAALSREESDQGVQAIYKYWVQKRVKEKGPLINFAFLHAGTQDPAIESAPAATVARVYTRLREIREDLEKVRLVADSARRREKLKKELIKLKHRGENGMK